MSVVERIRQNNRPQVPGYFRTAIGDVIVTSIYDGFIDVDRNLLSGAPIDEIGQTLDRNYVPAHRIPTSNTKFVVEREGGLILIDAGAGSFFGESMGKNAENLGAAGFDPARIKTILLTHMHPDLVSGLLSGEQKTFPNATLYVAKREFLFWSDPAKLEASTGEMRVLFSEIAKSIKPYQDSGHFVAYEHGEILSGIQAHPLFGHSEGHSGYEITTSEGEILFWGDIVHNHVLQFHNPAIYVELDQDPVAAVETRSRILEQAVCRKLWVGGAHLPFPGIGRITTGNNGYVWVPVEFGPTCLPKDVVHLEKRAD